MIGKILADNLGITDKLGGTKNFKEVEKLTNLSKDKVYELSNAIKAAKGDTIQLQKVLTETFENGKYSGVKGLENYIKQNKTLERGSINDLITKQNYENIAKQSFSFQGINANIKEYNTLLKSSASEGKDFAAVVNNHNQALGSYLINLNGANAGFGGYIKSLGIAKLKTFALSVATTALNMAVSAVAMIIVTSVVKAFDKIINGAEHTKKAVDDMVTSYEDSQKTLKTHRETIDDIKSDYESLSKGVDELGNNVSLTTEQYKKYNEICNQIADMYPSLVAGHTSEGNAILTLKGNVEALTKAYKDEQKAAAASVINGEDNENANVVKNYKNESKTGIKNGIKASFTFNSDKSMVSGLSTTQKISYLEKATNLSFKDLKNKSGSIGSDNVFRSLLKTYGLDPDSTDQEVATAIQNMKADLATYQAEVDEAMKGIKTKANAYFVYSSDYDSLNDEQVKQINSLINGALTEDVSDTFEKDSDISSKYVQKIIEGIKNNKDGVADAYKSLLKIDPNNMSDVSENKKAIDNYIKKIADYIGTDTTSLKDSLGYNVADDISEQYNNIITEATKKSKEEAIKEAEQNLQDEYDKITSSEFNLGKYKDQIKNGTLPSKYGNVDMDNRQVIDWNIENIEKWKDALQDIKYYDDDGNFIDSYYDQLKESAENGYTSIDTVFGDMMEHIEGYGDIFAVAFSHIVNNDDGTFEFLGQKTAEEYLYGILDVAKQDGDMSIDHILELDKKGIEDAAVYNDQGEQIGQTYAHGIISGFNDNAGDISKLTHFSGKYGAVQIAKDAIEEAKNSEPDFDWDSWFKEHSVNTQEEIDKWKEIASSANSAAEAREKYAKQADTFSETKLFNLGSDEAQTTLGKLNTQLDEIQSAYSTLSSAVSEYNNNGQLSIDTMQSIIALGDNWLDYIDMENGAFTLDQDALNKLTQARIEDMKQQSLANLASTVESITTEADATKYLASTNYDAANSYQELAKAKIAEVQANLQKKVDEGSLSQDSYDKVIAKFESDANKISQIFDNTSFKLTADGSIADSLSELEAHATLLKTVQDELQNTNRLSSSTLDSITKAFPELNEATQKFRDGLISSTELFSLLEQAYNDDAEAYKLSEQNKYIYSNDFWNQVITGNEKLQNMLTSFYGDDWKNWKNLAEAKAGCEQELVTKLGDLWTKYFNNQLTAFKIVKDAETGMMSVQDNEDSPLNQKSNPLKTGFAGAKMMDNLHQNTKAAQEEDKKVVLDYINQYNYARKQLQGLFDSSSPNLDITTDWKSLGSSSSSSNSGSSSDSSSDPTPEKLNWIERLVNKISTAYSRLKNIVSDTTSTWLNRNNALSDSMNTLSDEINAQKQAYEYYMNAFNSYGLDDYWKDQIANGSISIDVIYDDDLKDAISDCQDFYDKAQDAKTAVQSLNIEIRQLAKSRFDNVASQFEGVIGKITAIRDLYGKEDDLMQSQGWFSSTVINESMIEQEKKNLERLEAEKDALTKALNSAVSSGKIAPESEDWYSMQASIDDVTSSIFDAKKALVEYDNAIRQINWDAFDRTCDDVSNLIDETEFLVGLLKDKGITDDNGNMNDNGKAAQALLAQKYQLYLNQAQAYKDEILKINEELANDPYDKELLDRKQELIKAQEDSTNSAIDEKNAIKDLVNDGLTTWSDKLSELIDKYKDLMTQQKNAHDYEKTIAEKTKALSALQKQYSAYQGDNSEEAKKNIQQLKDQINTAKDDLSDTQYEQLISDTEKLLDNLQDETKTWIDERLDNIDQLMQDIIEQSNANASNIADTITTTANDYGIKLSDSMANIWTTNANNITGSINSVLGDFSNKFVEGSNNINGTCNSINSAVQGLLANSNAEAQRVADEIARQQAEQNANNDGGYSDSGSSGNNDYNYDNYWDDSSSNDDGGSSGSWGDWFYHLEDSYPKNLLEVD